MMKFIRTILLAVLLPTCALAQGQLQPGQVLGNTSASKAPATGVSMTSIIDKAFCTTQNALLVRGASNWACLTSANNAVLGTNGSGVPSFSTTLPSGLTAPSLTVTTAFTATGLVGYTALQSAALAVGSDFFAGTASKLVNTGIIYQAETTTTFGSTTTFDFNTFINTAVTLTGNITTMTLSNVTAGKSGTITFIQDGTGNRTTVWNSIFKFAGGTTPTLSTGANKVDVLSYSCRSATFCVASLLNGVQ